MQQQFLLQPLIDQNHAITPISQTVQLYNTKLKLTHAVEGVRIMLTPCEPFLKHSKPLVGAGTWALRYKDKIHDKTPAIIKGNDLVIFTNAKDAPSMLETIANIAKFHHDLHTIMDKVIINTTETNLETSVDEEEGGFLISRADDSARIYVHHDCDTLMVYMMPLSFFEKLIRWEGTDDLGWRFGCMPLSDGNRLVNIRESEAEDTADIEFTFPEDYCAVKFVVDALIKILAE